MALQHRGLPETQLRLSQSRIVVSLHQCRCAHWDLHVYTHKHGNTLPVWLPACSRSFITETDMSFLQWYAVYRSLKTASSWKQTRLKQETCYPVVITYLKYTHVYFTGNTLHSSVSLHLSIHVPTSIHHSLSGFFLPLGTMAKMWLCVPFLGTGKNSCISLTLSLFFFIPATVHLQKQWRGACLDFGAGMVVKRNLVEMCWTKRSGKVHCWLWIALLWKEMTVSESLALLREQSQTSGDSGTIKYNPQSFVSLLFREQIMPSSKRDLSSPYDSGFLFLFFALSSSQWETVAWKK